MKVVLPIIGALLTLMFSNEVQNFLYLSRDFDTSRVGEGKVEPEMPVCTKHCK